MKRGISFVATVTSIETMSRRSRCSFHSFLRQKQKSQRNKRRSLGRRLRWVFSGTTTMYDNVTGWYDASPFVVTCDREFRIRSCHSYRRRLGFDTRRTAIGTERCWWSLHTNLGGGPEMMTLLDEAHSKGPTVSLGLCLGQERQGLDSIEGLRLLWVWYVPQAFINENEQHWSIDDAVKIEEETVFGRLIPQEVIDIAAYSHYPIEYPNLRGNRHGEDTTAAG